MLLSAKKISILMSDIAPLWASLGITSLAKKCEKINIERDLIYRWLRDGAPIREQKNNLEVFCKNYNNACIISNIECSISRLDILEDNNNKEEDLNRFSSIAAMERIVVDQALAQFRLNHSLVLPIPAMLQDFGNMDNTPDYKGTGIYFLYRYDQGKHKKIMTSLVIIGDWLYYKISEKKRKRMIYSKLLNPHTMQQIISNDYGFDYYHNEGVVIVTNNYKYFIYQLSNYEEEEIIMFTVKINNQNLQNKDAVFKGKYLSVNLEGNDDIGTRDIELRFITPDVTDENISKYLKQCEPPQI